jgi:hypothetical protein
MGAASATGGVDRVVGMTRPSCRLGVRIDAEPAME